MDTKDHTAPVLLVELAPDGTAGRITVKLVPFLRLSDEMAMAIDALVHRWADQAAPAAQQTALREQREALELIDESFE
jgi:hypothetical protein